MCIFPVVNKAQIEMSKQAPQGVLNHVLRGPSSISWLKVKHIIFQSKHFLTGHAGNAYT